jgi:hypothetical protein
MSIAFNIDQYTLYEDDILYVRGYRTGSDTNTTSARLRVLGNPYQQKLAVVEGALVNSIDGSYSIGFSDETDSFIVGFKILGNLKDTTKLGLSVGPDFTNNLTTYDSASFTANDGQRPGGPMGDKIYTTPFSDDPLTPGIWRFLNAQSGDHFYATGGEADFVNDNLIDYNLEGAAWGSLSADQGMPTWRFVNRENGNYFWTASLQEYNNLAFNKKSKTNWKLDSNSFNVYSPDRPRPAGSVPVYRALNTSNGNHFWTANLLELEGLTSGYPAWVSEGVAWYSPA